VNAARVEKSYFDSPVPIDAERSRRRNDPPQHLRPGKRQQQIHPRVAPAALPSAK